MQHVEIASQISSEEFLIPAQNISHLEERIEALGKRARRIHCAPITLEHLGIERQVDEYQRVNVFYRVRVTGEAPQINGWQFIATIEHMGEGQNIVRAVPGMVSEGELKAYRECDPKCDHCHQDRMRNNTYILRSEEGEYMQVGKGCLRDFIGHRDPLDLAAIAEYLSDAVDACEEYLEDDLGRKKGILDREYFLSWVHACIRNNGWVSREMAENQMRSTTAMQAIMYLEDYQRHPDSADFCPQDQDRVETKNALAWIRGDSWNKESDYLCNLAVACKGNLLSPREFGLAASLFVAYDKAMEVKRERENASRLSRWQGTIGDRIIVTLTCNSVHYREACYGRRTTVTSIYHLTDEHGNRFTWFSSKDILEKGQTYTLKGTIKDHTQYQGIEQTVITRCKIV